jgi:hypothetical protein
VDLDVVVVLDLDLDLVLDLVLVQWCAVRAGRPARAGAAGRAIDRG